MYTALQRIPQGRRMAQVDWRTKQKIFPQAERGMHGANGRWLWRGAVEEPDGS
ncbi:hypothetical protein ACTQ50_13600 [Blautia sp. Sow4_E7]|uniref:hypothetical protein n=1 Tax=Blautia sp. Sow4_E7 TaxID=3438749 RepID=UPI003F93E989